MPEGATLSSRAHAARASALKRAALGPRNKTRHPAPQDAHRGEKRLKAALLGVLEGKGASTRDGLVASSRKSRDADHKENKSKIVTERLCRYSRRYCGRAQKDRGRRDRGSGTRLIPCN